MSYPYAIISSHQRKDIPMTSPIFEFSDDFDAVAWHMERMSRDDYDPYYDEPDDH